MEYQVAIVGGGPVGLGLAIDLGTRGISCALVEAEAELHHIPKGQNLTQRSMEHLTRWGVEGEVRRARVMPDGYPSRGVTAYGTLLGPHSYPWYRRSRVGEYYFCANERLPQYHTEAVLRDRASELESIHAWFGWRAASLDGAQVVIDSGDEQRTLGAEYVVGCDGSHSFVRAAASIGEAQTDHDRKMVLLVFHSPQLHRLLERFGETAFFKVLHPSLGGYWRFLGRVDVGETFFFHAPVPAETVLHEADLASLLAATVGADIDVEFDYVGFWDLRVAIADRYRNGRVFIAGDAAHSHPPYGGFGINTGFEDARNLGWKLAATLQGWGGARLLDSYDEERRQVFASTAADFIERFINEDREFVATYDPAVDRAGFESAWQARATGAAAEIEEFEPHYEGSPIVWGPAGGASSAVGSHSMVPRAGHHLPPVIPFDQLGDGFTAIGPAASAFTAPAKSAGVPLTALRAEGPAVLVRPDHYVAWVGEEAADPGAILARAIGATAP